MTTFKYKARGLDGRPVTGVIKAYDEYEAVAQIRREYPIVEKIAPVREREGLHATLNEPLWVSDKSLSLVASQFAIMLRAGLPMGRVVEMIAAQTSDKLVKRILTACAGDVQSGYSLSASLEKHGKKIPTAFIETVRAGEESGTLEVCFDRLKTYYEKSNRVKQKVRSAMTYPAIVILLMVVVIAIIMTVLVPMMVEMFSKMGTELPLPTRILMAVSHFFVAAWPFLLMGIAVIAIAYTGYKRTRDGAIRLGKLNYRLPVIGRISLMNSASQFANTLRVLLAAGLPAVRVLEIVSRVVDNRALGDWLAHCITRIEAGEQMGAVMRDCPYLPSMLVEMVSVGEDAGSLEETMGVIGEYYDAEAETASGRAIGLLEPMLTIVLGVVVAFIVIAIYIPMFTMETGVGSM